VDAKEIINIRQIAYNIFEYIKENPNKKLTKEQFEPLIVNPSNDKKVVIGLLRNEVNLSNEEIQELIKISQVNENIFYELYNRWEKNFNNFFIKEIHELKEGGSISNDMELQKFQEIDENDPIISEEKTFALDLQLFSEIINEKNIDFFEIDIEREKNHKIINFIEILDFWRFQTPENLTIKEFLKYLLEYKLPNEENLIVDTICIEHEKYFIINNEIIEEEILEEEDDFDL
jgi:hypothetical protein